LVRVHELSRDLIGSNVHVGADPGSADDCLVREVAERDRRMWVGMASIDWIKKLHQVGNPRKWRRRPTT
jgi:hypothetical protein